MPHGRKQIFSNPDEDDKILVEKKEKHIKRRSKLLSDEEGTPQTFNPSSSAADSSPLPSPTAVPSPRKNQNRNSYLGAEDDCSLKAVKKTCSYVGSFTVAHLTTSSRAEFVRLQLQTLQTPKRSRQVALFISISGIKVCDPEDEAVVLMAHALKRISYATCDPDFKQFAFLARNPKGPVGVQYCHVFITVEKYEVEEINAIVSKAFKVAYASIRSKKQFYKLVDELNREQEEYQSQVDKYIEAKKEEPIRPEELARNQPLISPDRVRGVGVGQSRVWAKQVDGRVSHKQPHLRGTEIIDDDRKEDEEVGNNLCNLSNRDSFDDGEGKEIDTGQTEETGSKPSAAPEETGSNPSAAPEETGSKPSAPPLSVGESQGQQEVLAKQTQKSKLLPPAPYYETEVRNDWATMELVPPTGISVVAETESDQSCHILLQDELSPPALPQGGAAPPPTQQINGRKTGQILLQDSSVPPPYNYNPRDDGHRSRKNSREELEDGRCYGDEANMDDTVCLLGDDGDDEEDFRYQMKCAEQFINATFDVESTDDELDYPWRRRMSSEDEEDRGDGNATPTAEERGVSEAEIAETARREKLLKANYAVPRPATRAPVHNETGPVIGEGGPVPQPRRTDAPEREDHEEEECSQYQRLGYSPPKPTPRQKKKVRNSVINDSENTEQERCKRHKNSSANDRENISPEPLPGPDAARSPENGDHAARLGRGSEEPSRAENGDGNSDETLNSRLLSPSSENERNLPHSNSSSGERRKRAPGHVNHKVEIEIGNFKVKKTATSERGSIPPLPPRSSSLHLHEPRSPQKKRAATPKSFAKAPWFKAGIPKEIAFEILRQQEKGAFIVRESKSHAGCYAISIKVDTNFNDSKIANYLVVRTKNGGYTIKGFGRDFADLPRLVHYYSLHQEQLPCKLVFSGTNPLYKQDSKQGDDSDGEEDPDYKKLTDFKSMLL